MAAFAFRTRCGDTAAAGALRPSYGAGVLEAPIMLNRSILVRGAFIGLLLVGLVVLADGVAQHELQKATGEMAFAVAGVQVSDASDD